VEDRDPVGELFGLVQILRALGVDVFFSLSPAISGSFTAGRLGIGGWMVLYTLLWLRSDARPRGPLSPS
jgi:hypothetical protein